MGHYHVHSLTPPARAAAELTLSAFAHLSETFVFMYMGLDLVAQRGGVDDFFDDSDLGARGADEAASTRRFTFFAVAVVPLSRAVVVPPLVLLANRFRGRKRSLSCKDTVFLVFAGLRGAIAYALARSSASPHQRTIVAATTAVVLFTTFVLGGTTKLMLKWLGMIAPETGGGGGRNGGGGQGAAGGGHGRLQQEEALVALDGGSLGRRFTAFDERVLQPLFGGAGDDPGDDPSVHGGKPLMKETELQPIDSARDYDDEPEG
jgi:hypothetical protein